MGRTTKKLFGLARGDLWLDSDAYVGRPTCTAAQHPSSFIFGMASDALSIPVARLPLIGSIATRLLRSHCDRLLAIYLCYTRCWHLTAITLPPRYCPTNTVRVIVDCRANIGITSLFLAAVYPGATILNVGPHPDNFALLKTKSPK